MTRMATVQIAASSPATRNTCAADENSRSVLREAPTASAIANKNRHQQPQYERQEQKASPKKLRISSPPTPINNNVVCDGQLQWSSLEKGQPAVLSQSPPFTTSPPFQSPQPTELLTTSYLNGKGEEQFKHNTNNTNKSSPKSSSTVTTLMRTVPKTLSESLESVTAAAVVSEIRRKRRVSPPINSSGSQTVSCSDKGVDEKAISTTRKCTFSSRTSSLLERPSKRDKSKMSGESEASSIPSFSPSRSPINGYKTSNDDKHGISSDNDRDNGCGNSNINSLAKAAVSRIITSSSKSSIVTTATKAEPETPSSLVCKRSSRIKKRQELVEAKKVSSSSSTSPLSSHLTDDSNTTTTTTAATISIVDDNDNDNGDDDDELKARDEVKMEKTKQMNAKVHLQLSDGTSTNYKNDESLSSIVNGCADSNSNNSQEMKHGDGNGEGSGENTGTISLMNKVFTSETIIFTWTKFQFMSKCEQEILWLTESSAFIAEETLKENTTGKKRRKIGKEIDSFTLSEEKRNEMMLEYIQRSMSIELKEHIESKFSSREDSITSCSLLIRSCVRILQPDVKCEYIEKRRDVRRFMQNIVQRIKNNEYTSITSFTKQRVLPRINFRWRRQDGKYSNEFRFSPGKKVFLFQESGDAEDEEIRLTCHCGEVLGHSSSPTPPSFTYSVMLDDSTVEHGIVPESVFIYEDFDEMKTNIANCLGK